MARKMKSNLLFGSLIIVVLLITGIYSYSIHASTYPAHFRWIPDQKGETVPEVVAGSPRRIPIEFSVPPGISRVALEISYAGLAQKGIYLSDEIVPVINSVASSQIYINLDHGTAPRRYAIEVIAREIDMDKIIGKGTIPFAVYPYFLNILKCSC